MTTFSSSLQTAIRVAQGLAREHANECFGPAHLVKALLHKDVGLDGFLASMDKDVPYLHEWAEVRIETAPKTARVVSEPPADAAAASVFSEADNVRIRLGLDEINPICVLTALIKPNVGFSAEQLKTFPLLEREILDLFLQDVSLQQATMPFGGVNGGGSSEAGGGRTSASGGQAALYKYCTDKTALAHEEKLDPILGRDRELRMMAEILGRRGKPNVMLVGESGVGKTALVDGFACAINEGRVPAHLQGARLFELDLGALIAGAAYKGEVEDRIKNILKDIRQFDKAILFIDDVHQLLDSKGPAGSGAANMLKPELAKGEVTIIGATTTDEYRRVVEADTAISRRFEMLRVEEPDMETAIRMLRRVLPAYEAHHGLRVAEDALPECVRLAKRYIKDRCLPDSAIDLLDRTMASIKMMEETSATELEHFSRDFEIMVAAHNPDLGVPAWQKELNWAYNELRNKISPVLFGQVEDETVVADLETPEAVEAVIRSTAERLIALTENRREVVEKSDIASVVSHSTGIPIGKIQTQERDRLLQMEDFIKRRVVGQDQALKALADAVLESRSGLNKPGQPIGSFFLLGPTGTGKTELAKSIAEFLFNDEKSLIRFDMSEFKEEHSAALLYGAPPGYVGYEEGGMLVNKIREKPYSVVLFDEIEKAHPSVFDIFLQILDEGKMHDRLGKEGDFSNSIILFTSNIGSDFIVESFTAGKLPQSSEMLDIMARYFRPEFLARLTEIVPFAPITEENVVRILDIHLRGLLDTLQKQGISVELTEAARHHLALAGFTPRYGARPLTGVIRNQLRRPISRRIISGELAKGHTLTIDLDEHEALEWRIA